MRVLTKVEVQGCVYGVVCVRENQRERGKKERERKHSLTQRSHQLTNVLAAIYNKGRSLKCQR